MEGKLIYKNTKTTKRNGLIEFLRFFFCLMIMFRHGNIFCTGTLTKYFQRGALGVEFFFLISGFLMACSAAKLQPFYGRKDCADVTIDFLKRKIKALCPELPIAFFVAFFVSTISQDNFNIKGIVESVNSWVWEWLMIPMAGFAIKMHMGIWYISAMLLAMFLLFPFCCKYFNMFVKVIAPIIALFTIGSLVITTHTTLGPTHIVGDFIYKGMIRAIGEVALGVACYPIIQYLKKIKFSIVSKYFIDIITFLCIVFSAAWMILGKGTDYDVACLLLIVILVCLGFSHQGYFSSLFDNKWFYTLGKLSLPIYLSHVEWAKAIKTYYNKLSDQGLVGQSPLYEFCMMTLIYILVTILTVCIIYIGSNLWRKNRPVMISKLKKVFIQN